MSQYGPSRAGDIVFRLLARHRGAIGRNLFLAIYYVLLIGGMKFLIWLFLGA